MIYQYITKTTPKNQPECLRTFLTWFATPSSWTSRLHKSAKTRKPSLSPKKLKSNFHGHNPYSNPHTIYFFHRPITIHPKTKKAHAMISLIHYEDYEYGLCPDIVPTDNDIFEKFQAHAFHINNIPQSYHIPYGGKWNFYPIDYLWDLDDDINSFEDDKRKHKHTVLPAHAHEAGYSQEIEEPNTNMDLDAIVHNLNLNIHKEAGPSNSSPAQFNQHSSSAQFYPHSSPVQQEDFEDYVPTYTCPGDEYGCCQEHIEEFEMDH